MHDNGLFLSSLTKGQNGVRDNGNGSSGIGVAGGGVKGGSSHLIARMPVVVNQH